MEQVRIWEHWKQSGKSIDDYIAWLASQRLSFQSFQRTARHHRIIVMSKKMRPNGAIRVITKQRKFNRRELALLDAVYDKFGRHYGWFHSRDNK